MQTVLKQASNVLLLAAAIGFGSMAYASGLPVVKDFTAEARDAKDKKVPILVLFMDETCSYCKIVSEDFLQPMQRDPEFDNKVILRQIESGSEGTLIDFDGTPTTYRKFAGRHHVGGVPNVMLFDSNGQMLTFLEGLTTVDFYYAFLLEAVEGSLAKVRAASH
jgi:thioredoxin-related protein